MNQAVITSTVELEGSREPSGTIGVGSEDRDRLLAQIESLQQKVRELEAERERLQRELNAQVGYWKSRHAAAVRKTEELAAKLEEAKAKNRELKQRIFGRKSERRASRDFLGTSDNAPEADESSQPSEAGQASAASGRPPQKKPKRKRGGQPGHPGHPRRDYSPLPEVEEFVDLPLGQQFCPCCGKRYAVMTATEDSEQIEVEVRVYRRVIRRRRYRRCCSCPGPLTFTAPRPPKVVPKSRYGTSVWVQLLLSKFSSHQPTNRLLTAWEQDGLSLSPATVAGGLHRVERQLLPAYQAILMHSAEGDVHQADETGWPVFFRQKGKQRPRWCLWAFSRKDSVVFRITPRHNHHVPEAHFASSPVGVLTVDRASVYKAMKQVKAGTLKLAFCWAHVRRDFIRVARAWPKLESWALAWLKEIRGLYRINRQRKKAAPGSAEFQQHQQALEAAIESFRRRFTDALADKKLHPACRRVMESLQRHWPGLTLFVQNPEIPMDNNFEERVIRDPVLGRKNYYGSGARWSVHLAEIMFSILATLELWNINPRTWLTWYLESHARTERGTVFNAEPFMPWNLSQERIAELRLPTSPPPKLDSS